MVIFFFQHAPSSSSRRRRRVVAVATSANYAPGESSFSFVVMSVMWVVCVVVATPRRRWEIFVRNQVFLPFLFFLRFFLPIRVCQRLSSSDYSFTDCLGGESERRQTPISASRARRLYLKKYRLFLDSVWALMSFKSPARSLENKLFTFFRGTSLTFDKFVHNFSIATRVRTLMMRQIDISDNLIFFNI